MDRVRKLRDLRKLLAAAAGAFAAMCSHGPTQPVVTTFIVSGTVSNLSGGTVGLALVEITAGPNVGQSTTADAAGHYALNGVPAGTIMLRASASGFVPQTTTVTVSADQNTNFTLIIAAASTNAHVFDAASSMPIAGVVITGDGISGTPSDGTGTLTVVATSGSDGPRPIVINAPTTVQHQTNLRVPGNAASIGLIASTFDLTSFNQMFRVPKLLRWTTAPPLIVEMRALQFVDVNASDATAVVDQMSDDELATLLADLNWALPQMTGGTFNGFASTTSQLSDTGVSVHILNPAKITVTRVVGLTAATGFWGYSRWQFAGDGTITAGLVTLDRDFERSGSPFRRSLRTHELGHALGYNHVSSTTSVMNTSGRIEPNAFDLAACRIAFARPPGNLTPDIDPSSSSTNVLSMTLTWSPPIR